MPKPLKNKTMGLRSDPLIKINQYPEIDAFQDNDSLKEGIRDLKILISNINEKTNVIMDGFESEDSESVLQSDISLEYEHDYRSGELRNLQEQDLPQNSPIAQHLRRYREHIETLNRENRNLRRQLAGIGNHLNNDLTKIYDKLN
mmetsp:Transcript_19045/g.16882  ORF Transcript_19045/g.16882 Transcript_19045/m.16882 type:complete len:145 (+) Transcript_19045:22-456(+)